MRSKATYTAFLAILLGAMAATPQSVSANEPERLADQTHSEVHADGLLRTSVTDAGTGAAPDTGVSDCLPADGVNLAPEDGERADIQPEKSESDAGSGEGAHSVEVGNREVEISPVIVRTNPSAQTKEILVANASVAPSVPTLRRLPIFGLMADVGVPDGLIASLAVRPLSWLRVSGGAGTNAISRGWRAGVSLLPFGQGPSASIEYGRYQEGNANALANRLGFGSNSVLERVGYEYLNAHLGLDFGFRHFVFFLHGGVTMLRGQIHNLDAAIRDSAAQYMSTPSTLEVTMRHDPKAKAMGPSAKLGFIFYIW